MKPNAPQLCQITQTDEHIDGHEGIVFGNDYQTVARPDEAGSRKRGRLTWGNILNGTSQVGETGNDQSPLDNRTIKEDCLRAGGMLPEGTKSLWDTLIDNGNYRSVKCR